MSPPLISVVTIVMAFSALVCVNGRPPKIDPNYATLYILEKRGVNMSCTSPQDGIEWTKDGNPVTNYGFKKTKKFDVEVTLTISKTVTSTSDSGTYVCGDGNEDRNIRLKVVSVMTQSSNVTVGEDVTIRCDPNTDFNELQVIWSKGGQRVDTIPGVKERVKLGEKNFSLTLQKTVGDDDGEYQCEFIFFKSTPSRQSFVTNVFVSIEGVINGAAYLGYGLVLMLSCLLLIVLTEHNVSYEQ